MFSRNAVARVLPFAVYMGFIVVADLLARAGFGPQELRWLYGVKVGAVVLVLLYFRREYSELRRWMTDWRQVVLAVLAGLLVLGLWVTLDAGWMQIGQSAGWDPRIDGQIDWALVLMRISGAALVVPLMEELFWRSFLMRWLTDPDFLAVRPNQARWLGIVVTVVLFGFEHNLWLAGIVAGAVYSILYRQSGNLWSPTLAHAVTNGGLGLWIISTGNWTYW